MPQLKPRLRFVLHCLTDGEDGKSLWQNDAWQKLFSRVDPALYPHQGLWPKDDSALPSNLSRAESNAIKNYLEALLPKVQQGSSQWRPFQVDTKVDEYTVGRKALTRVFEGLLGMARFNEQVETFLFE